MTDKKPETGTDDKRAADTPEADRKRDELLEQAEAAFEARTEHKHPTP